jgi:hypothetical protein
MLNMTLIGAGRFFPPQKGAKTTIGTMRKSVNKKYDRTDMGVKLEKLRYKFK